jgi:hypothetical protein
MMTEELFENLKKQGLFYELEWFGIDLKGQIGFFIAGDTAYVPEKIWYSYKEYEQILSSFIGRLKVKSNFEILESIGDQTFNDYANSGLYTYDYLQISETNLDTCYTLMTHPPKPINVSDLELDENLIQAIPKLNVIFGEPQINYNELEL